MRTVRVAACQLRLMPQTDFDGFMKHIRSLLDQCHNADIVIFPEYANLELVENPDIVSTWLQSVDLYRNHIVKLLMFESLARAQTIIFPIIQSYSNSAYVFQKGDYVHQHKTHLIHRELKWGATAGTELHVMQHGGVKFGIAMCYDIEFPEVATELTKMGAEIIFVPAATFSQEGYWRVAHCAVARAIENQVYVVHCPLVGELGSMKAWGKTSFMGPADVGMSVDGYYTTREDPNWNAPELVTTWNYDLNALHDIRESSSANVYKDRFPDK